MDSNSAVVKVRTSVKHPFARKIMEELDGKVSQRLGKAYKVEFV